MAVGMMGFIGWGVESSNGGSAQIVDFLPFVSENLGVKRTDLPDPSIWNNFDERRMYNGQQRVEGTVQVVGHPLYLGHFLRLAFDTTTTAPGSAGGFWSLAASHSNVRVHHFITKQTVFQAGSGSDLPCATIEVNRGPLMQSGSSFMYYNVTGNALELAIEAGGFFRASLEMIGRDAGGKARSTPSYVPQDAFLWNTVSVSMNDAGSALFQSLTVRIDNNLQGIAKLDGRLRPDLLKRSDFRRIVVRGAMVFQDFTEYDRFLAGSETQLEVIFTGKQVSTSPANNEQLYIDVPQFRYSTFEPAIAGPGPIQINWEGRGMIAQNSGYSCQIMLVNTRVSPYLVNTTA